MGLESLINKVTCGDCLEVLKQLPDNSVDSMVTDPPYFLINESGNGFMGKEWESLNNSKIIDIVCKQKNNVCFVEQFLLLLKVEQNTIVENIAQENASITPQNLETQKNNTPVAFAENVSEDMTAPSKADTTSVRGFVLTKEEVLVMLKESYPNHTPSKIEKCNDSALFVIPYTYIKKQVKNTVLENVLKLSIESTCSDREIHLLSMEEARINDVIAARIGIWLKNKYMNEMDIAVNPVESIVDFVKYKRIISNHSNFQKIMNYLTLLLYASDVMPKSRMELFQSVIKTFYVNCFSECCRVLKDGAFAFICFTPRQDSLSSMIDALKQAGFVISFTPIYWCYSSGFPKASNMAKLVDKRLGVECETSTRTAVSASGSIVTDLNPENNGLKREYEEKLPTSSQAKALDGAYAGFQPKPAVEVIIVAMKPLSEKTYVEQALKNGKGITWLDDVRIPFVSDDDKLEYDFNRRGLAERSLLDTGSKTTENKTYDGGWVKPELVNDLPSGRFPANLLVSDDVLNNGVITTATPTSGNGGFGVAVNTFGENANGKFKVDYERGYSDSGSFSRYFDLDRWFSERIKKLPKEVRDTFPFLIVPKPAKSEKDEGCENLKGNQAVLGISKICKKCAISQPLAYGANVSTCEHEWIDPPLKNSHPTVKPVDLMSYLITIGSRPNDIVLEPFCGSGTTMVSAWLMNRNCIGIELNPDYVKIAEARFKEYNAQQKLKTWSK